MPEQARIAVVGAGWWSTYTHIPALQAHPDVAEIVLCDADAGKLAAAADAYAIEQRYTDVNTMLATTHLDGAIIATSHASHYALAKTCLAHNLPIMIEKPMTLYARDARDLVETAQARRLSLSIGYPYHLTAHVNRARQMIAAGELGAIQLINCFMASHIINLLQGQDGADGKPSHFPVHGPGTVYSQPHLSGGGQGHLQITHAAGLMFFVSGLRAQRVHALMHNHGLPLDLVDAMLVTFEGGALGTVSGTGNQGSASGGKVDLQIYCEQGSLAINVSTGTVVIHRRNQEPEVIQAAADDIYPRFATAHNLVDVILGKAANGSPGEVGWRTVELLDAAYQSAAQDGGAVWVQALYAK